MSNSEWFVPWRRDWLRCVVASCTYSNFAGAWYKFARDSKGRVIRFWTRKAAQAYADALNKEPTP